MEDTESGDFRVAAYHEEWYLIQAFDDMKYGYQIIEKINPKDYEKEIAQYGELADYKSPQEAFNQNAAHLRKRGPNGEVGGRFDTTSSQYGREDISVPGMASNEVQRGEVLRRQEYTYESGESDRGRENGPPINSNNPQFSFSDDATDQEHRSEQGWYDTDEKQLQAKKKGYPVLHGEQVVPFNTWVQTKDRGNYGLVTGLAPENKLLVSFHNKHDGGTADNVAIPYENLILVPGAYQMTKEEFASLMESEPIDPGSLEFTEEEMREINELYDRARGEADTQNDAQPIDLESLPRKAQNFLRKTQRGLLRKLGDRLGVARFANRSYLQEIVDEISVEYLNSGTVSDEKMSMLFDKAYSQGIVADREFYEQYKHIKDVMRTTAVTLSEQDRSNIADFGDFAWLYRLYKSIELKLL